VGQLVEVAMQFAVAISTEHVAFGDFSEDPFLAEGRLAKAIQFKAFLLGIAMVEIEAGRIALTTAEAAQA
jgi:hypothetical protein